MVHRNSVLTPVGRRLLVERFVVLGWPVAVAAESMGVSRETGYRWLRRFRAEGVGGLVDRSSRPVSSPRRTAPDVEERICRLRVDRRWGPHRIAWELAMPRSTVARVLARRGLGRLDVIDPPTRRVVRRYERSRPGELVHVDVKKLGRIPDGGGWRAQGRGTRSRASRGLGYDYLHVAVDDHTRLAYVEALDDEQAATCAAFIDRAIGWFGDHGIVVQRVMTDNAWPYVKSHAFAATLLKRGARHLTIHPYRPQTNGKAERFNKTLQNEWAYDQPYTTNSQRRQRLPVWLHDYNCHRLHTEIGGPPSNRLPVNNLCMKDT